MNIREELPGDRAAVREIHVCAFGADGEHVADLADALRDSVPPPHGLCLVAEQDGSVTGSAMFTRSLLDAPRRLVDVQVLSPPGVLPEQHKRGIGSALVRRGLEILAGRGVPPVFLEGSPRDPDA